MELLGAYRNPPEHMAQIFQEVTAEYDGKFKKVYFAIINGILFVILFFNAFKIIMLEAKEILDHFNEY